MGFAIADMAFGSGEPDYAAQATEKEFRRQVANIQGAKKIDNAYAGFTPEFYQKRAKDFEAAQMPQLSEQYNQTRNAMGFNLANRGLMNGSAAEKNWTDLATTMTKAKQNVSDAGIATANDLQNQVQNSKNQQLNYLYQSSDPGGATAQATATAAGFRTPSAIPQLANQFSSLLNQYYTGQLINNYRPVSYVQSPQFGQGQQTFEPSISQGTK